MYYFYATKTGEKVASTMPQDCLSCMSGCTVKSEITKCLRDEKKRRRGKFENPIGSLYLCSSEESHIKSSKFFKKELALRVGLLNDYISIRSQIENEERASTRRLIHNIIALNAHCIQEIYSFIPQEELSKTKQEVQRETIQRYIENDRPSAAHLFSRILKNNSLMKVEFSVFNKLYEPNPRLEKRLHPIRKVILNVFHVFFPDFTDKNVVIKIDEFDKKISLDYESITVALIHIIENSSKYVMPGSKLKVFFELSESMLKISFDMISLKIDENEYDLIFDEGYSGKLVKSLNLAGRGIGLFFAKKVLELNSGKLILVANNAPEKSVIQMGFPYENNVFIISLPLE